MGQQQLLLIILGVIVVGIAVAVGITMFTDNAVNANRDAVTNDLVNLAARAQQFYRRPTALGGGGNSFIGLTADAAGLRKLDQPWHQCQRDLLHEDRRYSNPGGVGRCRNGICRWDEQGHDGNLCLQRQSRQRGHHILAVYGTGPCRCRGLFCVSDQRGG